MEKAKRSKQSRRDPTQSTKLINSFEKDLNALFREYIHGAIEIVRANKDRPEEIGPKIDKLMISKQEKKKTIAEQQVIRSWEQGQTWAELNIKRIGRGKKV